MNDYQLELEFAKGVALKAGEVMRKYFLNKDSNITVKSDKTLLTIADTEINSMVIDDISSAYPAHSVWGEEERLVVEGSQYTWVCDPVDGTMPFAKGIPISSFSLALVNSSGESVVGVVFDPFQNRLYEARKGNGAFMNGSKLSVSQKAGLDVAYIDQELWVNDEEGITFDDPRDVFSKKGAIVTTQCSVVIMGCFVAQGSYDAMIFGQGKPEDIAAISVIVREAGGTVTDLFGRNQRYDRNIIGAIVSNGRIHEEIIGIISNINYTSKYIP